MNWKKATARCIIAVSVLYICLVAWYRVVLTRVDITLIIGVFAALALILVSAAMLFREAGRGKPK